MTPRSCSFTSILPRRLTTLAQLQALHIALWCRVTLDYVYKLDVLFASASKMALKRGFRAAESMPPCIITGRPEQNKKKIKNCVKKTQ